MEYHFAPKDSVYEHLASGRVLYNQPGATAFPVRLASELFQRCCAYLEKQFNPGPYRIYDPCCGGAFQLTALGFLHGESIQGIYASDIDDTVLALAEKNLHLLTPTGLEHRIEQLKMYIAQYNKDSHREALESALWMESMLKSRGFQPSIECFPWEITKRETSLNPAQSLDMVITDLPYGALVQWHGEADEENASEHLLEGILPLLKNQGIAAVISGKRVVLKHPSYRKMEGFKIGKRHILILVKTGCS